MHWSIHLRESMVLLPTNAQYIGGGSTTIEPVGVADVKNADALRKEIKTMIDRGNPVRSMPKSRAEAPPLVLPKYAGVKSWLAYARKTRVWHLNEKDGIYSITPLRDYKPGSWKRDESQTEHFPPGTPIETVIDRMAAILQAAAAE